MSSDGPVFLEIYGFETPKATVQPKAVTLPWEDDPLWSYTPPSEASAVACSKIENDGFVRDVLGELPQPATPEPEPVISTPRALNDLLKFAGKLNPTRDDAPPRAKREIVVRFRDGREIVNPTYDRGERCYWLHGIRYAGDLAEIEVK